MVTISAAFAHLDDLVLDYIERRWNIARNIFWPHLKTDHGQEVQEIRLEEIYLLYFAGSHSLRNESLQNIMHSYPAGMELNQQLSLPQLPLEIVEQILEFGSAKQLRRLRCLSRGLNTSICRRLQQYKSTRINVSHKMCIEDFLNTFENRITNLSLPFRQVSLGKNFLEAFPVVLKIVGSQLLVDLNYLEATALTRKVLANMKNVCSLHVCGLPNIAKAVSEGDISLPALRKLNLLGNSSVKNLNFEYIKSWFQLAPSLRVFCCKTPASLAPALVNQLFDTQCSLSLIRFNGFDISRKHGEINVSLMLMGSSEPTAVHLEAFADFVRSVEVHEETTNRLPTFPRLTHLTVRHHPPRPLRLLQLKLAPHLEHVTLENAIFKRVSATYRGFVFEGVVSLHLIDSGWAWTEHNPPLFHLIFPNVATLELSGRISTEYVNYFATRFTGVSHLKFKFFDSAAPTDLPIFRVRIPGQEKIEWPFCKLQRLKRVEFACDERLRSTVLALVCLTLNKYIQPLEKLIIVHSTREVHEDYAERSLFYSMRHLKYHKELEISFSGPR